MFDSFENYDPHIRHRSQSPGGPMELIYQDINAVFPQKRMQDICAMLLRAGHRCGWTAELENTLPNLLIRDSAGKLAYVPAYALVISTLLSERDTFEKLGVSNGEMVIYVAKCDLEEIDETVLDFLETYEKSRKKLARLPMTKTLAAASYLTSALEKSNESSSAFTKRLGRILAQLNGNKAPKSRVHAPERRSVNVAEKVFRSPTFQEAKIRFPLEKQPKV